MTANMIDGTAIAASIQAELTAEVAELKEKHGIVPGLATVLVGDNPASQTYVKMKRKRCAEVGIYSVGRELPADAPQEQVEALVRELNADPAIHGILVQLPLPGHIDAQKGIEAIDPAKDVDGFHPLNIGRLSMKRREPLFVPCTPRGCIELIPLGSTSSFHRLKSPSFLMTRYAWSGSKRNDVKISFDRSSSAGMTVYRWALNSSLPTTGSLSGAASSGMSLSFARYSLLFSLISSEMSFSLQPRTTACLKRLKSPAAKGNTRRDVKFLCLLYTSPSPRDRTRSRMPSSA